MPKTAQYLFTYPDLHYKRYVENGDLTAPVPLKEFLAKGVCLPYGCEIAFSQKPKESINEYHYITLKIQIPITALSTFSFGEDFDKSMNPEIETVLVGEVTLAPNGGL